MARGWGRRPSKAAVGVIALSVAAASGEQFAPEVGEPLLSSLFALVVGCVVFLVVFVLGLSLVGGADVPRRRR